MRFLEAVNSAEPEINVIDKTIIDDRTEKVFDMITKALQRSFGPMGSHATITHGPFYHSTKDGFTIMKNIRFNTEYGCADRAIASMISDICSRLNYAVGDGTTSAVIAANKMYKSFMQNSDVIRETFFLNRNVINRLHKITDIIVEEFAKSATDIKSLPVEDMVDWIRKVVYISSNGDEDITNTVADMYREIKYPAITVSKAVDGNTKGTVVSGFMLPAKLADRMYVTSDNDSQEGDNYDVIVLDHKVTLNTYKYILRPIQQLCLNRGRKLICMAPTYDETALHGEILNAMNNEYRQRHDLSLILMSYKATDNLDKKRIGDFAMLCNTDIVTKSIENSLIEETIKATENMNIHVTADTIPINIDHRGIEGIRIRASREDCEKQIGEIKDGSYPIMFTTYKNGYVQDEPSVPHIIRLGFVGHAILYYGQTKATSIFSNFFYDESLYEKYLNEANKELNDAIERHKKLGSFTLEVDNAQKRLMGLKMIMGTIEVGATSEFSQDMIKDTMDDAVRAAESAFRNGVVTGGHIDLLKVISTMIANKGTENHKFNRSDMLILQTIYDAFKAVRYAVFENGFENVEIDTSTIHTYNILGTLYKHIGVKVRLGEGIEINPGIKEFIDKIHAGWAYINLYDLILEMEMYFGFCLNLDVRIDDDSSYVTFDRSVINSMATDREILIATADLIGILITSNQFIMAMSNTAN